MLEQILKYLEYAGGSISLLGVLVIVNELSKNNSGEVVP
jgi:hypothetical protein